MCLDEALSGGDEVDSQLIQPCKCTGSVSQIHVGCLKEWIKTKRKVVNDNKSVVSVLWKDLICELCKSPFLE